jgi:tetratricopeptide (TPR) repeat protein
MPAIFLSYRRTDSQEVVGRMYDRLIAGFPGATLFRDLDSIPLGRPFPDALREALSRAAVTLVVIGPHWVSVTNAQGLRRLDDPTDYVRLEVETALASGRPVVPVLVSGAAMPRREDLPPSITPLRERQGVVVRPDPDFHRDMDRLIRHLAQLLEPAAGHGAGPGRPPAGGRLPPFAPAPTDGRHQIPLHRNRFFEGRERLLSELDKALSANGDAALCQAISGMGGYGKTQTALEYAYRHQDHYRNIFWVRADRELETQSDFVAIARLLDLPEKDARNPDDAVRAALRWLETHDRWLLVFDNADRPELIRPFLPRDHRGHVLITSRAQVLDVLGISRPLEIGEMSAEEATAFLLKRTGCDADNPEEVAAAARLGAELGYLPLALEQAGACVAKLQITLREYYDSYLEQRLELLEQFPPEPTEYPQSVATTWTLNFQHVERVSAASADLLRLSAFLNPDNLPYDFLLPQGAAELGPNLAAAFAGPRRDRLALSRVLKPLRDFALIRHDRDSNTYRIHRLVCEVVKSRSMGAGERDLWRVRVQQALLAAFARQPLSPMDTAIHCARGLELSRELPPTAEQKRRDLQLLALLGPAMIATRGYASPEVGETYERAWRLCRKHSDPIAFRVLWGRWGYHYVRGELGDARRIGMRLLDWARAHGAGEGGYELEARRAIGSTLFSQGRLRDAREHFRRGIALYDAERDADHHRQFAVNPFVVCVSYLVVASLLADGDSADRRACRDLDGIAAGHAHDFSRVFASFWLACARQIRQDAPGTAAAAQQCIDLSRRHHFPQWEGMGSIMKGWALARLGRAGAGEAVAMIEEGLAKHESTGARVIRPYFLALLAESHGAEGRPGEGLGRLDQALELAAESGEGVWTAEILRLQADLTLAGAPAPDARAESLYRQALKVASGQGARALQHRCLVRLRDLLGRLGREEEATALWRGLRRHIGNRALGCDRRGPGPERGAPPCRRA